jgi:predicted ATPase/DNA-binding SARP family transcriptional activator
MATSPIRWRFELFGGLSAGAEGHTLGRIPTQKTAALLARLVYPPCRYHPREQLVDLLWPDADADSGRNRLSQALVWLRPQLEPNGAVRGSVLLTDRAAVGLDPGAISTDIADFEAALKKADTVSDPEAQIQALVRADDLYQGELLPGHYEDWVLAERHRLTEVHLNALRRLAGLYERAGDFDAALAGIRRVLDADPLQEEVHYDLMRLLAAGGRTTAALRQFQELERLLARELDVSPSPASRALADRIRRADPPAAVQEATGGPTRFPLLPVPLTRFFGRTAELARLEQMVQAEGVRLVTLLGAGGSGKTRLALEAAARLARPFAGAVAFVPLAALDDQGAIHAAIAAALLLPRVGAPALGDVVAARSTHPPLLVLDNLEHLIDGVAPVVRELLARLPSLTVLATSQQRLGVEGEQELSVAPLPLPTSVGASPKDLLSSASVQLFVDRARMVRPDFTITPQNASAVAQVCERLEGVPLAIELCAAWAQMLTPAQMLTQLARRFDLLVSRRADIAPRHRTLRAALEYGFVQLSPDLQRVFAFLSVFRGGWTLPAAEAVCVEEGGEAPLVLDAMTELRERSLLVAEEVGTEMRYRMLEALREFAAEQRTLAVETALRRRHEAYFLRLAEEAELHLTGPQQAVWLARLEIEHDNMRVALAWALETEAQTGLRLASALANFWSVRGFTAEGQNWLARLLALPVQAENREALFVRAKALNAQGHLARARADYSTAETAAREALGLSRGLADETGIIASLQILATLTYFREDYPGARAFLEEALVLGRHLRKPALVASILLNLGNIAMEQCDWPQAWELFSESLALCRAEGDPNKVASALNNLGLVACYRGDLVSARSLFQEDLALCRSLANRSGAAIALLNLGTVERMAVRFGPARESLREAVTLALEVGDRRALAWCVKGLGHLACAEGDFGMGVLLLAASESLRATLGISFKPADPEGLERDTRLARAALGEFAFDAAWTAGLSLTLDAVLNNALPVLPSSDG